MAIVRLSKAWNGIPRAISGCRLETSYALYADMDGGDDAPYLRINGLSIYADTQAELSAILPAAVRVDIGNATYSYTVPNHISGNAYSPSGRRMPYYAALTSAEAMEIPSTETEFQISVTVTPAEGDVLSFTEQARRPIPNSITAPESIRTGVPYGFPLSAMVPVGTGYQSNATLVWSPMALGVYTTQVYEEGYVDPYTKVSSAAETFGQVYFAVANPDNLQENLVTNANVHFETVYLSSDFANGCIISEADTTVPVIPSSTVDEALAPIITEINMTESPAEAVANGKYVHKKATLTFSPVVQFKYGDSMSYVHHETLGNRYAASISAVAEGITPGESYTRPDTGETETAGDTSVRSMTLSVGGGKWKLLSAPYTVCYDVLYYTLPRVVSFNVYRMSVSQASTNYRYNGVYYKKDDFGAYGMAEFTVSFSSLDGENQTSMTLQYGTHRIAVTPDANGYGIVVFPANTAVAVNVNIVLYDNFIPYGVSATKRLSTGTVLMDYLSGGTGMAIGKAATERKALDIAEDWKLLFYQATGGAYEGDIEQDLVAWMHDIDGRLDYLENSIYAN